MPNEGSTADESASTIGGNPNISLSLSLCLSLPLAALSINTRVESRESEPLVHYLLIQLPSRASPPSCTSGPIPPTVKLESRHGAINGFPSRSTRPLCLVLVVIICTAVLNWFQYVSLFFSMVISLPFMAHAGPRL